MKPRAGRGRRKLAAAVGQVKETAGISAGGMAVVALVERSETRGGLCTL